MSHLRIGVAAVCTVAGVLFALYKYYESRREAENEVRPYLMHNNNLERFRDDVCPICLNSYEREIVILPCSHMFHKDCIKRVFESSGLNCRCPVCRVRVNRTFMRNISPQLQN